MPSKDARTKLRLAESLLTELQSRRCIQETSPEAHFLALLLEVRDTSFSLQSLSHRTRDFSVPSFASFFARSWIPAERSELQALERNSTELTLLLQTEYADVLARDPLIPKELTNVQKQYCASRSANGGIENLFGGIMRSLLGPGG